VSASQPNSVHSASVGNPIVVGLLALIFLALVILIGVVALQGGNPSNPTPATGYGQPQAASKPKAIANADRIKATLKKGMTYRMVLEAGLEARAEDKAYSVKTVTNLVYKGEFIVARHIRENDGKRIIEDRTFEVCRTLKAESHVADLKLEWGVTGDLALVGLEFVQPGSAEVILFTKPLAEMLLKDGAQKYAQQKIESWASVDTLTGKSVRITYEDGQGVVDIQPLRGELTPSEQQFVRQTAVLSDCYILPDMQVKPGKTWSVDAYHLSSLVDPTLRAVPQGTVTIKRKNDDVAQGKQFANLAIQSGYVLLDSSDNKAKRVGSFTPAGDLRFNLSDGYVQSADLTGQMKLEHLSKDHLLFETRMRTEPKLKVRYRCSLE
jgi:hypothetical protein